MRSGVRAVRGEEAMLRRSLLAVVVSLVAALAWIAGIESALF